MRTNFRTDFQRRSRSLSVIPVVALVVLADLIVAYVYVLVGFWPALGALIAIAAAVLLFTSPQALILTVFFAKPLIDMLWFASSSVAGVSLNAQSILSIVILFASLMFLLTKRVSVQRSLAIPMVALLLTNIWAVFFTHNLPYASEYLIRIVCGFPLVFVVPEIVSLLPEPRKLLNVFFVVLAFVCVTVLLQPLGLMAYTSFDDVGGTIGRATGFYYHPWDVARYVVILIPLLLAALDESGRKRITSSALYVVLLLLALITTYVTFLKAAWIAVLFQILLWLFLTGRQRVAFLVLGATVLLVALPLRAGFASVFSDLWKLGDESTRGQALSGRVFVWSEWWNGLRSSGIGDILFGQGYLPPGMGSSNRAAHDDYLRVLVMNGALGLIAYFWLIIAAMRAVSRAVAELAERRGIKWRIGLAVQCLIAAYLLMGITADPSSYPSLTIYLWLLIGLVIGYTRTGEVEEET
jgi:hypothetical protein